jgi:hypothetical protein
LASKVAAISYAGTGLAPKLAAGRDFYSSFSFQAKRLVVMPQPWQRLLSFKRKEKP